MVPGGVPKRRTRAAVRGLHVASVRRRDDGIRTAALRPLRDAMRYLLIAVSLLVGYGSLYPFDFGWPSDARLEAIFAPRFDPFATSRGDLLGNVALFVPFGVAAMLAARNVPARGARWTVVLLMAGGLAFFLQAAQLFIPSRDPRLLDVFWNLAGAVVGGALGGLPAVRRLASPGVAARGLDLPLLLAAVWVASQFLPFVPSLDLQLVKNSLKPLLLRPVLPPGEAVMLFAAWIAALALLARSRPAWGRSTLLALLPVAALLPQPFILANDLTPAEAVAAVAAAVVWLVARGAAKPPVVAGLLAAGILAGHLAGFDFAAPAGEFSWVPFSGFLEGGMLANAAALARKVFLYGALVWWLQAAGLGLRGAAGSTVVLLAVVEALQAKVPGATPEITDPILAALLALALRAVAGGRSGPPAAAGATRHAAGSAPAAATAEGRPPPQGHRLGSLDGLRGFAALAVFGVHFNQVAGLQGGFGPFDLDRLLVNGNTGVALFFVLSGFLLAIPFWKAHAGALAPVDGLAYALRRVARILPAFYACLLAIVLWKMLVGGMPSTSAVVTHLLFLFNLHDGHLFRFNPSFWTLAVEMQFYLLLPLLFLLLRPLPARAAFALVAVLCIGAHVANHVLVSALTAHASWPLKVALLGPVSVHIAGPDSYALAYSLPAHLAVFLAGTATAWLFVRREARLGGLHGGPLADAAFWIAALVCLIILATPLDTLLVLPNGRYNWPFVPLLLCVLVFAGPLARSARALLDSAGVRWLGAISYGVYLFHYPLQRLTAKAMSMLGADPAQHWIVFGAVSLGATVAVASASFVLLERPLVEAVRRWRRLHRFAGPAAVAARAAPAGAARTLPPAAAAAPASGPGWVSVQVGLSAAQLACVESLARDTGRSVSGAVRLLVNEFIAGLAAADGGRAARRETPADPAALAGGDERLQVVHLRAEQAAMLDRVGAGLGLAVARTVQLIVDEFARSRAGAAASGGPQPGIPGAPQGGA